MGKINRAKVHAKYNGHCAYCGKEITIRQMQVDHIQPKFHYEHYQDQIDTSIPVNSYRNLNPACARCNNWKRTFTVERFREEISLQVERLKRDSAGFRLACDYNLVAPTNKDVLFYFEIIE